MSFPALSAASGFFRDGSLRESLARITFRDVLLASEHKSRSGARQFHPLAGMTRELASLEIVRQYGQNRVASYASEPREQQLRLITAQQVEEPDLLLHNAVHSVFGRTRTPVSFILDIDAEHETPEETKNWQKFDDRILAFILFACRKTFARHALRPSKICVLTAGDGSKPYSSLHLHIDFTDTVFVDATSITNFIKGELCSEIHRIGAAGNSAMASRSKTDNSSNSSSSSSSAANSYEASPIGKYAQRVMKAIDAQPFASVGGSLRIYGAPKADGTRPCKLFRPELGGAAASALLALAPTEGGPTIELMKYDQKVQKMLKAAMAKKDGGGGEQKSQSSSSSSPSPVFQSRELTLDMVDLENLFADEVSAALSPEEKMKKKIDTLNKFDVLNQLDVQRRKALNQNSNNNSASSSASLLPETSEILLGKNGIPVVRKIELEALAMSLGTPDWLSPIPFRFVSFANNGGEIWSTTSATPSFTSQQYLSKGNNTDSPSISTSTSTPTHPKKQWEKVRQSRELPTNVKVPGQDIMVSFADVPPSALKDIAQARSSSQFPFLRDDANPETFMHLAQRIAPAIPACFAEPYRTWLSVALALTDIAAYTLKHSPESRADEVLEVAFLEFSKRARNYDREDCIKLFRKMVRRKKYDKSIQTGGAKEAREAYKVLTNIFRKPAP